MELLIVGDNGHFYLKGFFFFNISWILATLIYVTLRTYYFRFRIL